MQYLLTFLEGLISFISPCMLPMLPVYLTYFLGESNKKKNILPNAISFVLGFTVVFCALGILAGSLGAFLDTYKTAVNIVTGAIVIFFGLSYLEIIPLKFLKGMSSGKRIEGEFSAFVFGIIFAVSFSPCVGAFLGSALMLATSAGSVLTGGSLLLVYSLGLGLPFIISAVLIDKLQSAFSFIKKHYRVINTVCGIFLIVIGILMMLGFSGRLFTVT